MMKIGVIFGGRSGEHEVSLMSATSVIKAIDKDKYSLVMIGITKEGKWLRYDGGVEHIEDGSWQAIAEKALADDPEQYELTILGTGGKSLTSIIDFALPILHGTFGEDGTIQGLFEMMDIPYGGCGVLGSAAAMDKALAKDVFAKRNLPVCRYLLVKKEELEGNTTALVEKVERFLPYPIFIKPANAGSSVGVSKVHTKEDLIPALKLAAEHDRRLILEEGIDCRELETAILGNHDLDAAVVGEILSSKEFYDYQAKYGGNGASRMCIPADIPEEMAEEIRTMAKEAYGALDCAGFARVDFFLDKNTNKIYLNEINTIPGFTKYSMFPLLWAEAGVPYAEQIERIISLGLERHREKEKRP